MADLTDLIPTGTEDFDPKVRDIFDEWQAAIEQNMDELASLVSRLSAVEDGSFFVALESPTIPDGAIIEVSEDKVTIAGTLTDGVAKIYREGVGWILEPIAGVVGGDTYQNKWDELDTPSFMAAKVASDAELVAGTANNKLVTPAGLKLGKLADKVKNWSTVSGSVTITPEAGVHVLELAGNTTITFSGFTDASVHYTVMLIITNTAGRSLSWGNSVRWPGDKAPDMGGGRYRVLFSTYDGGSNFDASNVIEYAA